MTASRRSGGRTSRNSSSRLPTRSVPWVDSPVTLPPGRAKLATMPPPTGSFASAKTMGMTAVTCFTAATWGPAVTTRSTLQVDELGRDLGGALGAGLRPAILDRDGAAFDPAKFMQSLNKSSGPWMPSRSVRAQDPNSR